MTVLDTLDSPLGAANVLAAQERSSFDLTPNLGEIVMEMASLQPEVVQIGGGTDDTNWQ